MFIAFRYRFGCSCPFFITLDSISTQRMANRSYSTLILLPNQLFHTSLLPRVDEVIVWEDPVFFGDRRGSPQKYAQELQLNPLRVEYQKLTCKEYVSKLKTSRTLSAKVTHYDYETLKNIPLGKRYQVLKDTKNKIIMFDSVDHLLNARMKDAGIHVSDVLDTPAFLLTRSDIAEYIKLHGNNKTLRHSVFYEFVKNKLGILQNVKNLDKMNRSAYPKDKPVPKPPHPFDLTVAAGAAGAAGTTSSPKANDYPFTHDQALRWFKEFLTTRFASFGKYEDAIVYENPLMYHSGISIYLNNGLLKPKQVVSLTLEYASKQAIPLSSLEGFVRQIIGWREFCRLYYVNVPASKYRGNKLLNRPGIKNKMAIKTRLSRDWYDGTTGIPIVDNAINDAFRFGYLHHIRRLMIMANYMTLSNLHSDLIYKWMYEFSLDSWDWVMVFNCYSMGSYSDGGIATWKPYISSSSYVKKMAHEPSGDWEQRWNAAYKRLMIK